MSCSRYMQLQYQSPIRSSNIQLSINSRYVSFRLANFIENATNIDTLVLCAVACLNNDSCNTANYFSNIKVCSLYAEY
ncbi:unnamed protein product, partial [Didymodactylos carnosus]